MKTFIWIFILLVVSTCLYSNNKNEPVDQSEEETILQEISFKAIENPYIRISFQDQRKQGLLMGMEADSILIEMVLIVNLKVKDPVVGSPDNVIHEQSSMISQIQRISINEIHHIRVIKESISDEYSGYGPLIGVAIGAALGAIIGIVHGDVTSGGSSGEAFDIEILFMTAEELALCLAGVFGLLGGLIGAKADADMDKVQQYDLSEQNYFQKIHVIRKLSGYEQ